jgi:LysR family glycine cleavage system transcriptional activator
MRHKRSIQPILNALSAFEEAARTSSFTLAAQSLGMAQPSVSRFIANLERQIGVPLFTRQHNRVALTPQGLRLYEATVLGLGHIRSVVEEISDASLKEVFTINCTHGFAHMWVLPRIEKLKARLGGREIRIVTIDHTASSSIDDNQLAIRFGDGDWSDGESLLLFREDVYPVCSPDFAAQQGLLDPNLDPDVFSSIPLLVQDKGEYGWLSWPGWFEFFGSSAQVPPTTHVINNYAFILQAAMEGKGVALAWQNLIEPYLSNGWLISLPNFRVQTDKGYYLVHSANHPIADDARAWIAETV